MHFLDRDVLTLLQAHLTERVLVGVPVTDPLPCTSVLLIDVRGSLELVVFFPGLRPVLFTVGLICQLRAAGIVAGAFRFCWHGSLLLSVEELPQLEADDVPDLLSVGHFSVGHCLPSFGYGKGPGGLLRRGPFFILFPVYMIALLTFSFHHISLIFAELQSFLGRHHVICTGAGCCSPCPRISVPFSGSTGIAVQGLSAVPHPGLL